MKSVKSVVVSLCVFHRGKIDKFSSKYTVLTYLQEEEGVVFFSSENQNRIAFLLLVGKCHAICSVEKFLNGKVKGVGL